MSETTAQVNEERIMNDSRQAVMAFNARVNDAYKNIVPYTPVEGRQSINQQQAEYILKEMNYPRQRKVNSSQVNTIIDKMLTGAWIDGHTISFAKCDGKFYLVNGQHRMMAIAKCGKRQVFSVIISNCKTPDDVHKIYCTHDTGVRARSKVEVLASFGFSERYGLSKSVASKLYESSLLVEYGFERQYYQSNPKVRNVDYRLEVSARWAPYAKHYEDAIKSADQQLKGKLLSAGTMAVALATFRYAPEVARAFWTGLAEQNGLRVGDPRRTLALDMRNRILNSGSQDQGEKSASVAWNAYAERRQLKIIKVYAGNEITLTGTPWGRK